MGYCMTLQDNERLIQPYLMRQLNHATAGVYRRNKEYATDEQCAARVTRKGVVGAQQDTIYLEHSKSSTLHASHSKRENIGPILTVTT